MAKKTEAVAESGVSKDKGTGAAPFTMINYVLFAVGLLDIVLGWFLLRGGHITVAPIMLIIGYCLIIPMAIIYRRKKPENG